MEYYRLIRNKLLAAILILSAGFFTACGNDDIKVGSIDEENYQTPNDIFGYIINHFVLNKSLSRPFIVP